MLEQELPEELVASLPQIRGIAATVARTFGLSDDQAQDIAQDAIVRLLERHETVGLSFRDRSHLLRYIWGMLRNLAMQRYQDRLRTRALAERLRFSHSEKREAPELIDLKEAISRLPKLDQRILNLKMEGYSTSEIASLTQKDRDTVRKRLERAKTAIRQMIRVHRASDEVATREK